MKRILFCSIVLLICLPAFAQQPDVNRFTLFTGFDYMVSPARNLTERGFESDFGVTLRPWLALGADFSVLGDGIISGAGTINGSETIYAPTLIAAAGHGLPVPPPSLINVPFSSQTYTFAAGPQFYLRKWKKVTLFARRPRADSRKSQHQRAAAAWRASERSGEARTQRPSDRHDVFLLGLGAGSISTSRGALASASRPTGSILTCSPTC